MACFFFWRVKSILVAAKSLRLGLIQYSIQKYGLDINNCFVVGDMGKNEIVMAHNAGCKGILVLTGGG